MKRQLMGGFVLALAWPWVANGGEIAVLSPRTWDEFAPQGKEVDAIFGDLVLRNDRIVAVVAQTVAGRNANLTVRDVGGCILDLTLRSRQGDQLGAYYPGARRFPYRLVRLVADDDASLEQPGERHFTAERVSIAARDGTLEPGLQANPPVLRGRELRIELEAAAADGRPAVRLTYTLRDGAPAIEIRSEFTNSSDKAIDVATVDDFRADRTFESAQPGATPLAWVYDKWWGQAYGIAAPGTPFRLSGSPANPRTIEFLHEGKSTRRLAPSQKATIVRQLFPAADLVAVKAVHARLANPKADLVGCVVTVKDVQGQPVAQADVDVRRDNQSFAHARTTGDGTLRLDVPPDEYRVTIEAPARGSKAVTLAARPGSDIITATVEMPVAPRVAAEISDVQGKPIPCKVQFLGVAGTPNPFFFPDTGDHAVHNVYYSHTGRFTQELPAGKYDVLVSYGPEYNSETLRGVVTKPGETTPIKATLQRVVETSGWISSDFHSHSSPSGDNVSSQRGRVLNLLCEHIEFAPCTEHNRVDSYVPHLKALGIEKRMGTCTGIELTGQPLPLNHQNAFPLVWKPHTQDGGGPTTDADSAVQIKRLALWDDASDKLVQQNHPDLGWMFYDRDGDQKSDAGFQGMFEYQDVVEVHPPEYILEMEPTRTYGKNRRNHVIFNWLQLLNQGRRTPGVVNTDAHYNFHGSGFLRNYVRCPTDVPGDIKTLDIVHASEKGHIVMTNGPFLEVAMRPADKAGHADDQSKPAIPGDDLSLPGGFALLHVRVQCPNWFDIDRVQILLNGRKDEKLNWTRSANPDAFGNTVVKFDRRIPIELKTDTHVIAVAVGENLQLGPVMGPEHGRTRPVAVSNPIFVDVDGGGFKANGDTLGQPLPVKENS
jgi:hypothetical protein